MAKARIKKTYKKLGYFHRKFKSVHDGGEEQQLTQADLSPLFFMNIIQATEQLNLSPWVPDPPPLLNLGRGLLIMCNEACKPTPEPQLLVCYAKPPVQCIPLITEHRCKQNIKMYLLW